MYTVHVMELGHREVTDFPQRFRSQDAAEKFAAKVLPAQREINYGRYLAIQDENCQIVSYVGD